jgi:hypothetical protein
MNNFGLPQSPQYDVYTFAGNTVSAGVDWVSWRKPHNRSMAHIFLVSSGGGGGTGVIGANSSGGRWRWRRFGCSGHIEYSSRVSCRKNCILSIAIGSTGGAISSFISIEPSSASRANSILAMARGGAAGGNASGATAGSAGTAGAITAVTDMPLGWAFAQLALAGQAGIIGGTTGAATDLTVPTTGLRVTGGAGGGGVGIAGSNGARGGGITTPAAPSPFPAQPFGGQQNTATSPPGNGSNGYIVNQAGLFFYGGTGCRCDTRHGNGRRSGSRNGRRRFLWFGRRRNGRCFDRLGSGSSIKRRERYCNNYVLVNDRFIPSFDRAS